MTIQNGGALDKVVEVETRQFGPRGGAGVVTVLAGCGGEDDSSSGDGTGPTASTTLASSSTDPPIPATAVDNADVPIVQVQDLEYLVDGEATWTLDVAYPDAPGPWPLVVAIPTSAGSDDEPIPLPPQPVGPSVRVG